MSHFKPFRPYSAYAFEPARLLKIDRPLTSATITPQSPTTPLTPRSGQPNPPNSSHTITTSPFLLTHQDFMPSTSALRSLVVSTTTLPMRSSSLNLSRSIHTSPNHQHPSQTTLPTSSTPIDARWLALQRSRLGKCINFGLPPSNTPGPSHHQDQAQDVKNTYQDQDIRSTPQDQDIRNTLAAVVKVLALEWRDLVAGSEGFLTEEGRRGLWRRRVEWGEMVSC